MGLVGVKLVGLEGFKAEYPRLAPATPDPSWGIWWRCSHCRFGEWLLPDVRVADVRTTRHTTACYLNPANNQEAPPVPVPTTPPTTDAHVLRAARAVAPVSLATVGTPVQLGLAH